MPDTHILVCALADQATVIVGSSFSHVCSRCHRSIVVAPSGKRFLRKHKDTLLVCLLCGLQSIDRADAIGLAAGPRDLAIELNSIVANPRRSRN